MSHGERGHGSGAEASTEDAHLADTGRKETILWWIILRYNLKLPWCDKSLKLLCFQYYYEYNFEYLQQNMYSSTVVHECKIPTEQTLERCWMPRTFTNDGSYDFQHLLQFLLSQTVPWQGDTTSISGPHDYRTADRALVILLHKLFILCFIVSASANVRYLIQAAL